MFIAHAPVGWWIVDTLRLRLEAALGPLPWLRTVSVAGALAPDLDLLA